MQFRTACRKIGDAYSSIGHRLGWRFLYSPRATYRRHVELLLLGMNPGGSAYSKPSPSFEAGNAYRLEPWGRDGALNCLQRQIGHVFALLAREHGKDVDRLMDSTVSANFCPFRSRSVQELHAHNNSIRFSRRLWEGAFPYLAPRLMICIGLGVFQEVGHCYDSMRWIRSRTMDRDCGWGEIRITQCRYSSNGLSTSVIGLPHLARFAVFGRKREVAEKALLNALKMR
jgi:hypothetical protein